MELLRSHVFGNPHSTNPASQAMTNPIVPPDMRVDEELLLRSLDQARHERHNFFAYPAQSNVTGVQHPLDWIQEAHARGWVVLVDCAAFSPPIA